MSRTVLSALIAFTLATGTPLATEYTAGAAHKLSIESSFSLETTEFTIERDGVPMEGGFGADTQMSATRSLVIIDRVLESNDGVPQRLSREFESVSGSNASIMGDRENESDVECPLDGVTLELSLQDGDVSVEQTDGDTPDDSEVFEGHRLTLGLDALLPSEEVNAGDSWELDGEALSQALGFDLDSALFPKPEPEERGARGEGDGGRGRNRGPRGGGADAQRYFAAASWDLKATLDVETTEYQGIVCHVIQIKGQGSGELPERERGQGRDRQDQTLTPSVTLLPLENSFEIDVEAELYIRVEGRMPLHFELEGIFETESNREMQRRESLMVISSSQAGELKYSVNIEPLAQEGE
jgi:hypothetical protein